jgi:hypothetical protein
MRTAESTRSQNVTGIYRSSPESLAIIDRIVADAPEFSPALLSRITTITGLVPVD